MRDSRKPRAYNRRTKSGQWVSELGLNELCGTIELKAMNELSLMIELGTANELTTTIELRVWNERAVSSD